jgi:hypothetical protein
MDAAAVWPATSRHGANHFFENVLGNREIYEENAKFMFTDDGLIELEVCDLDGSGILDVLRTSGINFLTTLSRM